ncbi:hypothetical protein KIPB_007802 [Kipferlia bialata]|uniref:Uncharacterized protein n=1 Tax=Kipferlia bialata TaxID=797122 RepID=A0A9K3CZR0_9EUKA|nr:hypothetical protein KIPB_007802 [Kipferlia bialata]|eukprot:g7802.t1
MDTSSHNTAYTIDTKWRVINTGDYLSDLSVPLDTFQATQESGSGQLDLPPRPPGHADFYASPVSARASGRTSSRPRSRALLESQSPTTPDRRYPSHHEYHSLD